jgi:ATP-dependent helicase HrpA
MERVPDDLRITFSVEDEHGSPLATGKDLRALVERFSPQTRAAIADAVTRSAAAPPSLEQGGLRSWTIGTLPRRVEAVTAGHTVVAYPALIDDGESVSVHIFATAGEQAAAMWKGTRRLLALTIAVPRKQLERQLSNQARLAIAGSGLGGVDAVIDECLLCTYDQLLRRHGGPRWDEPGFAALRELLRADVFDAASVVLSAAARAITAAASVVTRIDELRADALQPSEEDMRRQLRWLVHPAFITSTGADRLPDVARYVDGIGVRLDKLAGDAARDRTRFTRIRRLQDEIEDLLLTCPPERMRELLDVRWLIEELRISVFAQALGTSGPVSEQRIERALDALSEG